jgi:hypothetical protein
VACPPRSPGQTVSGGDLEESWSWVPDLTIYIDAVLAKPARRTTEGPGAPFCAGAARPIGVVLGAASSSLRWRRRHRRRSCVDRQCPQDPIPRSREKGVGRPGSSSSCPFDLPEGHPAPFFRSGARSPFLTTEWVLSSRCAQGHRCAGPASPRFSQQIKSVARSPLCRRWRIPAHRFGNQPVIAAWQDRVRALMHCAGCPAARCAPAQ